MMLPSGQIPEHVRAARREIEAALDTAGWPWRPALSRWLDALLILEEDTAR